MPRDTDWKRIIRTLERTLQTRPGIGSEIVDELERWEREALDRVIQALVDGMGARRRYDSDPLFYRAIRAIAQIAVYAIFEEPLVTEEERNARREGFDLAFLKLPEPPPRPIDTPAYRSYYLDPSRPADGL